MDVITVEGLSKRFALRHLAGNESYATFRDTLSHMVKTTGRRLVGRKAAVARESSEEFWALKDLNFTVRDGEKIGIVGRNGAGKSTLFKVISRVIEPTRGRIRIRGRVASLLEVGTGFHPELTGRENIFFNGAILGMTKAEIRRSFDAIVDFAEVEKFLDTPVKHYSSGMYVRLGFAVAAHLEPEILMVDEVLAVGDARFQRKCLGKLQEIGREGRTVLFVSHNMSSILQFSDRVILLQSGRIALDGDSESGVREYLRINESASQAGAMETRVPWLRITELAFDPRATAIGFNQPLAFRLGLATDRPVDSLELVLFFVNSIGARIVTGRVTLPPLSAGSHRLDLRIPDHRLIPGFYWANMTLLERTATLFHQEQVISFELIADDIEDAVLLHLASTGKDRFGSYCPIRVIDIDA